MKGTNYIYASAKLRALEKLILDATDIERMIDAPDLSGAFKVLHDTDYGDNLLEVDPVNYRDALREDFAQLHDLLQRITPKQELFELILLDRDFINIKLFFKSKLYGVDVNQYIKENVIYSPRHLKDFIYETHIHSPEILQAYISEQKGQVMEQEMKDVIYRVSKRLKENTRPDELDAILTQEYFDLKQQLAEMIGSRFIKNYIKMEIDTANLLIWVRVKRLGLSKEKLKEKLIKGGHADIQRMLQLYPEETRGLRSFVNANFDLKILEVFEQFCENDNLWELEKAVDDYKVRYARMAKHFSYGPEVIFAYYLAKVNAVTNVRIILTGKLAGLPTQAIRETIREVY